ncbi:MAG: hypothetical protein KAJ60_09935 [Desulfobulbaceae bacterium]|nr:hypothetical protein [Desulfobulbaceae bacterium]
MEKNVEELRKIIRFKDTTVEGDIVLIATDSPESVFYALVTGIERDTVKREEWWHVTLHALSVPPQKVVWTLRMSQFTGQEIFTMGGDSRFIQAVDFGFTGKKPDAPSPKGKKGVLRVIK